MAKKTKKTAVVVEEPVVIAETSFVRKPGMRDIDVVYGILQCEGRPVFFRELLGKALEGREGVHNHSWAHVMSEIFTQMNMDSRFHHEGNNKWGLVEWVAQNDIKVLRQLEHSQHSHEKRRREMAFETIQDGGNSEEEASAKDKFTGKNDEQEDE